MAKVWYKCDECGHETSVDINDEEGIEGEKCLDCNQGQYRKLD